MSKEALKLALEALEANSLLVNGNNEKWGLVGCMDGYYSVCFDIDPINKQTNEAIAALREALANEALDKKAENARELGLDYEPAQQEPVAWICEGSSSDEKHAIDYWPEDVDDLPIGTQLYTSPPAQQQEPVATVTSESGNPNVSMSWWHEPALPVGTKLYTSPPAQRKPLTDEEKDAARWRFLVDNSFDKEGITQFHVWEHSWEPHSQTGEPTEWKQRVGGPALDRFIDLAIEAALGIKENT